MTTTAEATAAPTVVKLAGKTYRVSPLRDKDFGEFEAWVQDQRIAVVRRNLDGLEPEERQRQLDRAYDSAARLTIASPESIALMMSAEGAAKLLYLSLRREQPDITEEKVLELLTDPKTFEDAMDAIDRLQRRSKKRGSTKAKKRAKRKR